MRVRKSALIAVLGAVALSAAPLVSAQPQLPGIDPFDEAAPVQAPTRAAPEQGIRVLVESPAAGKTVESATHMAEVKGSAIAAGS